MVRGAHGFAAFAKASDGVAISGDSGNGFQTIYASESFLKLSGFELRELIDRDHAFPVVEDSAKFQEAFLLACRERQTTTIEFRLQHKAGGQVWDRVTFVPFVDERGRLTHVVSLHHDITAYKEPAVEATQLHAMRTTMATVNHIINNFMNAAQLYSRQIASGVPIEPGETHLFEAALRNTQNQLAILNRMGAYKDRPTPFGISLLDPEG